jgi:hypothetical protein
MRVCVINFLISTDLKLSGVFEAFRDEVSVKET